MRASHNLCSNNFKAFENKNPLKVIPGAWRLVLGALFVPRPLLQYKAENLTQKLENNNDIKSLSSFLPTQIIVTGSRWQLIFNTYSPHVPCVCKPAL